MLDTILVLLIVLWLLGMISSYTMGGFIHLLLVLAVAVAPGETLRYRCDRAHLIRVVGRTPVHATMVCILKAAVME